MRTSIVGMGHVGTATAHALVSQGLASDLVLTSRDARKAEGHALDLDQAGAILPYVTKVRGGDVELTADSALVILSHSVPTTGPGRKKLAAGNAKLFRETIPRLAELSPNAVFLVLSNPVDALTWLTMQITDLPTSRILGAGTIIDSARVRAKLSDRYGIHPDDLRVYILGEHGEEQFVAASLAAGGGVRFKDPGTVENLADEARKSAWEVFARKGYTNYAVAQAAVLVTRTVLFDEHRTLPVSTLIDGYLGESGVCLSLPCVVGAQGIERVLEPTLSDSESESFHKCAASVRESISLFDA